jgi:tRNA A-37 threonylcarbamoyl transferase component Bud32
VAPEEPATEDLPELPPAAASDLTGRTIGKFHILEKLGKGGSGDVYRAEQQQLGRSVVVKVLRSEVAWAPNRVERFLREAKLASRLDHPYAAHIYAFGAEADGVLWIAMEHVKGQTLDDLVVRRGAMPAHVFARLYGRLCEVVHTAHELGIVHRDIKGSNVMVIERAGQLLPKLLDFGIAKGEDGAVSPGVDGERALTQHGVTLGSPHYMSPEQWERPADVDARADIYALGVLAYRCACGYLPFRYADRKELAQAHLEEPPPPLPDFVPAAISDAIYRAMAKQPGARWPTALAFADAIQRAANTAAPETVPLFDPSVRDAWLTAGPQPIADAIAHLAAATTTVEADAMVRELVAITCRWLAVLALSGVSDSASPALRERSRGVVGRDDAAPWLDLARAALAASEDPLPGLVAALAGAEPLAELAERLDDRDRVRTAARLGADIEAASEALRPLEPLLAYQLVLGLDDGIAESWQGARRRDREKVMVWGTAAHGKLAPGDVALLDGNGEVVARLSPLAQVQAPLPSAEPELFLLWRSGRGSARLMAAPWGFERDDDAAGQRLHALSTEDSDTENDPADDRSPYPGLAAYGIDDADRFFGREREIEVLANRLVRSPMLAVLGPSGVGKSSFLHAGLVPRLGEHYRVVTMRPGRHPVRTLHALGSLTAIGEGAERGCVLVVDQLEELVTLCSDEQERREFAQILAEAADGPDAPVRVVASLRDDFATVLEGVEGFRGKFDVFVIATPPPEALRRIVVEPARRARIEIDQRVVEDMVAEVAGRPASLPLLSFTASQLWQTRDKTARSITQAAYLALGGVAGALASYADEIYASLARRDQDTVRDLFARLVAADGTRVPWPRRELEQMPGAKSVLAHLVDARLLVVRDDDGTDVIEIVHECLAERWPRLARWRSEDAADRALLGDVRAAARRWDEAGRRGDLLWRGPALADLRKLAGRSTALTELERAFADSSVAAQQRARRLRRGIVAAVMVALAGIAGVMAYLSSVANDSRARAERDEARAKEAAKLADDRLTQSLIQAGKRELNDGRSPHALAYFRAALERGADGTGLREMIALASRGWRDTLVVEHDMAQQAICGSPNGWIAAGDRRGHVRWWSDTGALIADVALDIGPITNVRRMRDDRVTAVGQNGVGVIDANRKVVARIPIEKKQVWLTNIGPARDEVTLIEDHGVEVYGFDGKPRRTLSIPLDDLFSSTFDPTERYWPYGARGKYSVLDLQTMTSKPIAGNGIGWIVGAEDGSIFGFLDRETRDVHLVRADGTPVRVVHPTIHGTAIAFTPTGDRFAAIGDHEVEILEQTGKPLATFTFDGDDQAVFLRGDDVWCAGKNGVIHHYHGHTHVASIPVAITDLLAGAVGRNAVGMLSGDGTLAIVRADATQYHEEPAVCDRADFGGEGAFSVYSCADGVHVYLGRKKLGTLPAGMYQVFAAVDRASGRAALGREHELAVVDSNGKEVARGTKAGPLAFEDADHLLIGEEHVGISRWTLSSGDLHQVQTIADVSAIEATGPGAYAVGTDSGDVILYRDNREVHRVKVSGHVLNVVASDDGHWLAVQLAKGDTVLLDLSTGAILRTLEAADAYGAAAVFDRTGDLVLRMTRGSVTLWDRATGENLVFGLDLLREVQNGYVLPDGRIETAGEGPGILEIRRDTRPAAEIIDDIACRVALHVVDSRLEPATNTCRH